MPGTFLFSYLIIGSCLLWLTFSVCTYIGNKKNWTREKISEYCLYVYFILFIAAVIGVFIIDCHKYFLMWAFFIADACIVYYICNRVFTNYLKNNRCDKCHSSHITNHKLESAVYETELSKSLFSDTYDKDRSTKKEITSRVWYCKCNDCGYTYSWCEIGLGDDNPHEIDKATWENSFHQKIKSGSTNKI